MQKLLFLINVLFILTLFACNISLENNIEREPLLFNELNLDSFPPCLNYAQKDFEVFLRTDSEYEDLRIIFAPQGDYIRFTADGIQRSFKLPYLPLDADNDGIINHYEIIIYVRYKPLYADIKGQKILVHSNPIHIKGDSILNFSSVPPFGVIDKIYYKNVFHVDSINGEVTFNTPPLPDSEILICASKKLYEIYNNRNCSMQYFNFSNQSLVGKSVTGDGCLKGFEKELFVDKGLRKIIYSWRKIIEEPDEGCPEISTQFTSWISFERQPNDYELVFIQE